MAKEVLEFEVQSDIGKTTKETDKLGKSLEDSTGKTKELRDASNLGTIGFGKLRNAVSMVGTALKALGVGLIISAFATLKEVFGQNQRVLDFFNTTLTTATIVFNDLFKLIEGSVGAISGYWKELFENPKEKIKELGISIQEGIYNRLVQLLEVAGFFAKAFALLLDGKFKEANDEIVKGGYELYDVFTGVDNTFDDATETIKKYTSETLNQAKAITQANKAALLSEVQFAKLNAEYLREAEIQRQVRDDVSKTFAVRIEANQKLSKVLADQSEEQKRQIQIQITAAKLAFDMNDNVETRVALGNAENAMLELKETITGQISEQLTNQTALEEELRIGRQQSLIEGTSGIERELEELRLAYEEKKRLAIKSGVDTTAITAQYQKDQTKIRKDAGKEEEDIEKAKKGMQEEMAIGGLQIIQDAAGEGTELARAAAIASATISGILGVQAAFTAANANIGATAGSLGVYPVTMASIAGAFAAVNIAKIASGSKPSSGGGGGGGGSAVAAPPAPQMMSGAFDISGGVAPEPLEAFVLTDSMTNSQNQLANIRRRATI